MATVAIDPGEVELLIDENDTTEYWAELTGTRIYTGRSRGEAKTSGRRATPGKEGPLRAPNLGEPIYAYNPSETTTALVRMDKNGYFWDTSPRAVVGAVLTGDDNEAAPASDDFIHEFATDVDVNSSTEEVSFEAPDRADYVVINCDDAAGDYHVEVQFEDANGNLVTQRDNTNSADYAGSSSTDIMVRTAVASPHVTVRIVDDSGATNTLDYSIYAR